MTVEGHHDGAAGDVAAAVADMEDLLRMYGQPEAMASGIVNAAVPAFIAES